MSIHKQYPELLGLQTNLADPAIPDGSISACQNVEIQKFGVVRAMRKFFSLGYPFEAPKGVSRFIKLFSLQKAIEALFPTGAAYFYMGTDDSDAKEFRAVFYQSDLVYPFGVIQYSLYGLRNYAAVSGSPNDFFSFLQSEYNLKPSQVEYNNNLYMSSCTEDFSAYTGSNYSGTITKIGPTSSIKKVNIALEQFTRAQGDGAHYKMTYTDVGLPKPEILVRDDSAALANNYAVRYVAAYYDRDGILHLSPPSDRIIFRTALSAWPTVAGTTTLGVPPLGIWYNHFPIKDVLLDYVSDQVAFVNFNYIVARCDLIPFVSEITPVGTTPSDELFASTYSFSRGNQAIALGMGVLGAQSFVSGDVYSYRSKFLFNSFSLTIGDGDSLSVPLYTNSSQEGILQENSSPRAALDVEVYGERTFYAGVPRRSYVTMQDVTQLTANYTPPNWATVQFVTINGKNYPVNYPTFNAATGVNTGTDVITTALAHGYVTGTLVRLTTGGTLPTGLLAATDYYVINLTATTLQLASSYANALSGIPVNITATGSGTVTIVLFDTNLYIGNSTTAYETPYRYAHVFNNDPNNEIGAKLYITSPTVIYSSGSTKRVYYDLDFTVSDLDPFEAEDVNNPIDSNTWYATINNIGARYRITAPVDNSGTGTGDLFVIVRRNFEAPIVHRLNFSKQGQPEAVPTLNFLDIGKAGYKIKGLKNLNNQGLFIFKEDGTFMLSGLDPTSFYITTFDPTLILGNKETLQLIGAEIIGLFTSGVYAISTTGPRLISAQINDVISSYMQQYKFDNKACAMIDIINNTYVLSLPELGVSYVYNMLTRNWTSWNVVCEAWAQREYELGATMLGAVGKDVDPLLNGFISDSDSLNNVYVAPAPAPNNDLQVDYSCSFTSSPIILQNVGSNKDFEIITIKMKQKITGLNISISVYSNFVTTPTTLVPEYDSGNRNIYRFAVPPEYRRAEALYVTYSIADFTTVLPEIPEFDGMSVQYTDADANYTQNG